MIAGATRWCCPPPRRPSTAGRAEASRLEFELTLEFVGDRAHSAGELHRGRGVQVEQALERPVDPAHLLARLEPAARFDGPLAGQPLDPEVEEPLVGVGDVGRAHEPLALQLELLEQPARLAEALGFAGGGPGGLGQLGGHLQHRLVDAADDQRREAARDDEVHCQRDAAVVAEPRVSRVFSAHRGAGAGVAGAGVAAGGVAAGGVAGAAVAGAEFFF